MAIAYAQYIVCNNKGSENDGENAACNLKFGHLSHPDLHFVYPTVTTEDVKSKPKSLDFIQEWRQFLLETPYGGLFDWYKMLGVQNKQGEIRVDDAQEIVKSLSLKAHEGGYKVMIIWMAEEMNATCANKLLKILEEPPKNTLFILLCESQDKMLQTIISRTQILKIPRISSDDLTKHLKQTASVSGSAIESIVGRVEGDVIAAHELLGSSTEQDENRELFIQLMRVCYKKDVIPMLDWAEEIASTSKERQKIFVNYALHMFRQSMLRNYTDHQLTKVSTEEDQFLKNFNQ
jgi:DNA polymerase-3 subunit delta'